jgi:hypothetical protein
MAQNAEYGTKLLKTWTNYTSSTADTTGFVLPSTMVKPILDAKEVGLLYVATAFTHRRLRLGYIAVGMLLAAWMLHAFYVQQWGNAAHVQAYAIPAGLYLLGIAYLEWQRGNRTLARWLECGLLLAIIYLRRSVAAARPREMLTFDTAFLFSILKAVLPVTLNEIIWSLGVAVYNIIYARLGTESLAAINIIGTVDGLAFVIFLGLGSACANEAFSFS